MLVSLSEIDNGFLAAMVERVPHPTPEVLQVDDSNQELSGR